MSLQLINRSPDLKRLRDEGYEIQILDNCLLVHGVPYVNSLCEIKYGTLVSQLSIAGGLALKPNTHVIYFMGDHPCFKDGKIIKQIVHTSSTTKLSSNIEVNHSFSNKPKNGYADNYEKVVRYAEILSHQAMALNPDVTPCTFRVVDCVEEDAIFQYPDTNASRGEFLFLTEKFNEYKVGIIGLGGTGAYMLDYLSKVPLKEIHIFDGDDFCFHNAFRSPGAASISELNAVVKKADYYHKVYSNMHKRIIPHSTYITNENLTLLDGLDFIFLSIDNGESKKVIIDYLVDKNIPFIDAGIGILKSDNNELSGQVRTTFGNGSKKEHLDKRISFAKNEDNLYASNIQIAELNSLNAIMAVIKWKKLVGFYQDTEAESTSIFVLNDNSIINDDY